MYTTPHYANGKIRDILRGHLERFRQETRLTVTQFELLAAWLRDNTALRDSKFVNLKAKFAIFLYIVGQGQTYRNTANY